MNLSEAKDFPVNTASLKEVRIFSRDVFEKISLPQEQKDELVLAIAEAAQNIVKHGYKGVDETTDRMEIKISLSEIMDVGIKIKESSNSDLKKKKKKQYLIKEGFTDNNHIFAEGGSAGGLLIGAVVNMEPQMWKGAIAAVPFVDVITTMLDATIPLTSGEWDEWGDPQIKKYYDYMLSYSPYDQIQNKSYPNLLVTSGFFDSQVQYWEPLKYVAKLREYWAGTNKLYLHMNMDAGHGGKSGRFRRYREVALEYAFMFDLAGIKK